jgi:hypothetical protein
LFDLADRSAALVSRAGARNTNTKDVSGWKLWVRACDAQGADIWRPSFASLDAFGVQRETLLLLNTFVLCFEWMVPKDRSKRCVKPDSVWSVLLVIYRVSARMGIELVPKKLLRLALKGANRVYMDKHGPGSLVPKRKDPYSPEDIAAVWALPPGLMVAGRALHWTDPFFVAWWAQLQVTRYVGFRKAEVTLTRSRAASMLATQAGVLHALSFAHLIWHIGGVIVLTPSTAQLLSLAEGDAAGLKTPPLKNDQNCSRFTNINWVPWGPEFDNAARSLSLVELVAKVPPDRRSQTFLFTSSPTDLAPISPSQFDAVHKAIFVLAVGKKRASCLSGHSGRIELACRMLAAGESPDLIKALLRWVSDDAMQIYARLNREAILAAIRRASVQRADSVQISSLPTIDDDEALAAAGAAMTFSDV